MRMAGWYVFTFLHERYVLADQEQQFEWDLVQRDR